MSNGVLAEKSAELHSLWFDPEKRIDMSTLRRGRCNHQPQKKPVLQSVCHAQDLETTPEGSRSPLSVSP